jgi:hypothetical protein
MAPEVAHQRQKRSHDGDEPPLQCSRRPDANQLPHEQSEIEAGRVNQQSLADVRMSAQVHAAQPPGFIEMCEGSFQALAA